MQFNQNKFVPIGLLFLVLAIVLPKLSNIHDLAVGILYGLSIGILLTGVVKNRQ